MSFVGTRTIEVMGRLMGLKKDDVNYAKKHILEM
jgi:hypothetical protein